MDKYFGITTVKKYVRKGLSKVALWLHKISGGRITPNGVTWFGLIMHLPIGYLIAVGEFYLAVPLLIIFGLFDVLDGELARLTGKANAAGMVLDAFTDRLKETIIHAGLTFWLATSSVPELAIIPAIALGFSLSTNFLKAKAEVAYSVIHKGKIDQHTLNRKFSDGALSFELRITLIIVALLIGTVPAIVVVEILIAIGAWQTPRDTRAIIDAINPKS